MRFSLRPLLRALLLLLVLVAAAPVGAQNAPLRGVVWNVPDGDARAMQDLDAMADAGVEAIRSDLIRNEEILRRADTLGFALYLDLPLSRLPASRMVDTLEYARAVVDTAAALARRHGSIRAVGLARFVDTSDSTTCGVLRDMRSRLPGGVAAYYVARFVEDDVCADAVDFVLLDARGSEEPAGMLRRWRAADREGPVGLASLGVWVRSDTLRGLDVPSSPERQARYLETQLPILLSDTLSVSPRAVFVHRWRDMQLGFASAAHDLEHPYLERYGLQTIDGTPRPAMKVLRGNYTGRQTVFAFDRGTAPSAPPPWSVLVGWAVVAVIGVFYALSPRFRHMLPRYFQARLFFRESVREGRDILLGASTVLLGSLGAATGIVAYVIFDAVRTTDSFSLALRWMPEATQGVVATLLAQPFVLIVLAGGMHVIALIVWSVILSLLSRRKYTVAPAQVLMLVVWPRWPMLLVMVAAMVAESLAGPNAYLIAGIIAAWLLIELASGIRTLVDFVAVTRIPIWLVPPAALLHPLVIVAAVAAFAVLTARPEATYLLHAVTRS